MSSSDLQSMCVSGMFVFSQSSSFCVFVRNSPARVSCAREHVSWPCVLRISVIPNGVNRVTLPAIGKRVGLQ